MAGIGRHHSTPWLGRIDVPTAVVVTRHDKALSPYRQRSLALSIPGATIHEVDTGHAGCVLAHERFLPGLLDALETTTVRSRKRLSA